MSAAPIAPADPPFPWRWLALVLLLTLLIRGTLLYLQRDNLNADVDNYREIANNLLHSGRFALGNPKHSESSVRDTAYRPPLYPLLLSYIALGADEVPIGNIIPLHLALGLGTVALTFAMAQRTMKFPWLAALAALLVACDPILLNQQSLVMTETLATFLAVLTLWQLQRFSTERDWWNALTAGAAIGLAILCRPTFLPWFALAGMALVRHAYLGHFDRRFLLGLGFCYLLGVSLLVSPWVYRNYCICGKPIVTTTHGGYTFLLGNNSLFYKDLKGQGSTSPWKSVPVDEIIRSCAIELYFKGLSYPVVDSITSEDNLSRLEYSLARDDILAEPGMFLWACVYRIRQLWSPLPYKLSADESRGRMALRYLTAAWYLGVYALAAMGIWRLRGELLRPPWIWGVLLCITFTAVHTFYWSNLRMRAPLMPFVALVAAAGAGALLPQAKSPAISAVAK